LHFKEQTLPVKTVASNLVQPDAAATLQFAIFPSGLSGLHNALQAVHCT
jgi:hypothetical protein